MYVGVSCFFSSTSPHAYAALRVLSKLTALSRLVLTFISNITHAFVVGPCPPHQSAYNGFRIPLSTYQFLDCNKQQCRQGTLLLQAIVLVEYFFLKVWIYTQGLSFFRKILPSIYLQHSRLLSIELNVIVELTPYR